MANIDYAALKKGGFMRQKQKGYFSLRLQTVGGNLTAENIKTVAEVTELIELENVEQPEYVTVSINEEFVASADKDSTVLKDGDSVEFLYFMGGGSYGVN